MDTSAERESPTRPNPWATVRGFSYGGTAAILTSMALIVGFRAGTAAKGTLVSSLLIVAIADNLTDSLSIHVYQESELLPGHAALIETISNFAARLLVALSFVLLVALMPLAPAAVVSTVWGLLLLARLTTLVARARGVKVLPEIAKHVVIACAVIAVSIGIGTSIGK